MDGLDELRAIDDRNYGTSSRALGETLDLLPRLIGLYDLIASFVDEANLPPRDDLAAGGVFLLGCRYALEKGVLELMRGHMGESFNFLRGAIEQAGFADLVRREPRLAMTWLNAGDDRRAYDAYRRAFRTGRAFPRDDVLMGALYVRYDFASQRIHSSLHAYAARLRTVRDEDAATVTFAFSYIDLRPDDLPMFYLWVLDTHFRIISVFARVFDEGIQHDRGRWDLHYNAFEAAFAIHRNRWRPIIQV